MWTESLKTIFTRDLQKLKSEIEMYHNEQALWLVDKGISNPGGNLCLHIIGNLNAYIGVGLAGTDYVRKRDLEFSLKNIPRVELLKGIEETILTVENGLDKLSDEQMMNDFPIVIWDKPGGMGFTLIHLATHLNYHLGQVNYHRRLLDKR
jgi:hypothetical protein